MTIDFFKERASRRGSTTAISVYATSNERERVWSKSRRSRVTPMLQNKALVLILNPPTQNTRHKTIHVLLHINPTKPNPVPPNPTQSSPRNHLACGRRYILRLRDGPFHGKAVLCRESRAVPHGFDGRVVSARLARLRPAGKTGPNEMMKMVTGEPTNAKSPTIFVEQLKTINSVKQPCLKRKSILSI